MSPPLSLKAIEWCSAPISFSRRGSQVCQIDRKPFVTGRDPGQGSSYHKACESFNSFWKIIFLVEVAAFGENPTPGATLAQSRG